MANDLLGMRLVRQRHRSVKQPNEALTNRLRTHFERLAGDIGEPNVFVPAVLKDAAA